MTGKAHGAKAICTLPCKTLTKKAYSRVTPIYGPVWTIAPASHVDDASSNLAGVAIKRQISCAPLRQSQFRDGQSLGQGHVSHVRLGGRVASQGHGRLYVQPRAGEARVVGPPEGMPVDPPARQGVRLER